MAITFLNERFEQEISTYCRRSSTVAQDFTLVMSLSQKRLKHLKSSLEKDMGQIDFIVHSIAFAPKEGLSGRFYGHKLKRHLMWLWMFLSIHLLRLYVS